MIGIQVLRTTGLAELEKRLNALPLKMERTIVGKALVEGAKAIVAPAKAAAPTGKREYVYGDKRLKSSRRPGQMKRAIRAMGRGRKQGGLIVVPIGFSASGFYGRFMERGWTPTGPLKQLRKRSYITRDSARGYRQQGRQKIPGLQFIDRAARQHMRTAVDRVALSIRRQLGEFL
jgi:hypothetical protein